MGTLLATHIGGAIGAIDYDAEAQTQAPQTLYASGASESTGDYDFLSREQQFF